MSKILGWLLVIAGIIGGLYIGVWWAFIGGIVQIIKIVQSGNVEALPIALNVAKILGASTLGILGGGAVWFCGVAIIERSERCQLRKKI